ncbi:MAG: RNA ligase family protein [Thermodesulfobacteriota bacterium]|nr:RNA ligase family protein [Thermodesulfobacteriota bacterium]
MRFKKYFDIENSYRKKFLDIVVVEKSDNGEFVVQEKAHGANLSFWYDGKNLKSAKRSGFIKDNFYDYKPVETKNRERVKHLYAILKKEGCDFSELAVYGELIGGTYPHKDVEKDTSATRIQKGIFYTPHNEFYAIDAAIDGQLLNVNKFNQVMETTGFLYAKTIFRGTFEECLKYSNSFPSQISAWLDLPELEDNICEGVVIKPVIPKFLSDTTRIILKNKNEKWAEKAKARDMPKKPPMTLSAKGEELFSEMGSLITENRLRNVISKIGSIGQKEFGKLIQLFSKDILDDFFKDHIEEYNGLEKKEQKQLTRKLSQKCAELIRLNFINIVDGEF